MVNSSPANKALKVELERSQSYESWCLFLGNSTKNNWSRLKKKQVEEMIDFNREVLD